MEEYVKIDSIALTMLPNETHLNLMADVDDIVKENMPQASAAPRFSGDIYSGIYPRYAQRLEVLKSVVAVLRKNRFTMSIDDTDKIRDKVSVGIRAFFNAYTYHVDLEIADAAQRVLVVMGNYGKYREKPYNEETASIKNLITDLRTLCGDDLETIGNAAAEWVDMLENANDDFVDAMNIRYEDNAERPDIDVIDARMQMNEVYTQMMNMLDILAAFDDNDLYITMIRRINERIRYYKTALAQHQGRLDAKNEEENE